MSHHHLPANDSTVHWGFFSRSLPPRLEVSSGDTVTINVSGATSGQDLIVGIKYNPSSVNGTTVGSIRPVVHYNFVTSLNGTTGQTDPDGLDLRLKP